MLIAVRTSSYGCTWEVWRALKKLELLSAAPRATLTLLSCSPNFPRASITRCTHAKHEPILNCLPHHHSSIWVLQDIEDIEQDIEIATPGLMSQQNFTYSIYRGIHSLVYSHCGCNYLHLRSISRFNI